MVVKLVYFSLDYVGVDFYFFLLSCHSFYYVGFNNVVVMVKWVFFGFWLELASQFESAQCCNQRVARIILPFKSDFFSFFFFGFFVVVIFVFFSGWDLIIRTVSIKTHAFFHVSYHLLKRIFIGFVFVILVFLSDHVLFIVIVLIFDVMVFFFFFFWSTILWRFC